MEALANTSTEPKLHYYLCENGDLALPYTCDTVAQSQTDCLRLPYQYDSDFESPLTWELWKPFVQKCQRACEDVCYIYNRFQQGCQYCGMFDQDFCNSLQRPVPSSAVLDFRYDFANRIGDREAFCDTWTFGNEHSVAIFRNQVNYGGGVNRAYEPSAQGVPHVRFTNWHEDRFSPFAEVYTTLETTPGTVYHVEARVLVDRHDQEFFGLQFNPTASQPCASGMVSVEDCPPTNLEEVWGCQIGRSAYPGVTEDGEWSMLKFDFTANVETSYLVIKVRYDVPIEVDYIEATDTGRTGEVKEGCACPSNFQGPAETEPVFSILPVEINVTTCIQENCAEPFARCQADDVCSRVFPKGLRAFDSSWHLFGLWDCVDKNCPVLASLETKRWIESPCLQSECFAEIARCESDRECTVDEDHPLRLEVQACEMKNCVTMSPTSAPTTTPTISPTAAADRTLAETPGLHLTWGSDPIQELASLPYVEYFPAFKMNSIPINSEGRLLGDVVHFEDLCNVSSLVPSDFPDGMVVLIPDVAMDCPVVNEVDPLKTFIVSARLVAQNAHNLGASMVLAYGNSDTAYNSWMRSRRVTRRNTANPSPMLLIGEATGQDILSTIQSGGNPQVQLSKELYCDSVWLYDIQLEPDSGLTQACCAAADAILAYNYYDLQIYTACMQSFPGEIELECEPRQNDDIIPVQVPRDPDAYCADFCNHALSTGNGNYEGNGICEDNFEGSDLSMCNAGTDCTDCGPRNLVNVSSAYPTAASFDTAKEYACGDDDGSCSRVVQAAIEASWGAGFFVATYLSSSCTNADQRCSINGLYSIPRVEVYAYSLPEASNSTCCAATGVIVSWFRHSARPGYDENILFQCPVGDDVLKVTCDIDGDECNDSCNFANNGICDDGGYGSAYFRCSYNTDATDCGGCRASKPDLKSFNRALELMCAIPQCTEFAMDTIGKVEHLQGRFDFVNVGFTEHGHYEGLYDRPVDGHLGFHGNLDLSQHCSFPSTASLCVVGSVYFITSNDESNSGGSMTCCEATEILFDELAWQGVEVPGITYACTDAAQCGVYGRPKPNVLRAAKNAIAMHPQCLSTVAGVVESERNLTVSPETSIDIAYYVSSQHHFFEGIDPPTFLSIVEEEHACWLRFGLDTPVLGVPQVICTAFDVWMSRRMWEESPSLAIKFYSVCVSSVSGLNVTCGSPFDALPRPDEATFVTAQSILCRETSGMSLYAALFQAAVEAADIPELFWPAHICSDPCRCSDRVASSVGCGFHDPDYGRPYCFVANPSECAATASAASVETDGRRPCALDHDSCQDFLVEDTDSPCAAFVDPEAVVFVPAGATLESMQIIENVVSNLETEGVQNELMGWLLSASFDSLACYMSVGTFMCNSLFLQCAGGASAGSGFGGLELLEPVCRADRPVPVRLGKSTCKENVYNRASSCTDIVKERGLLPDMDMSVCAVQLSVFEESEYGTIPEVLGTRHFRSMDNFGEKLYGGDLASATILEGFSETRARQFASSCPEPFVVNTGIVFADGSSSQRFCVAPCPSFVYTRDEYQSMWYGFIVIGLFALFLNLFQSWELLSNLVFRNAYAEALGSRKCKNAFLYWIVLLSVLHGIVVVLPAAILFDDVPCGDCGTELCFGESMLCQLNKLSVFLTTAILFCIVWGMYLTTADLRGPLRGTSRASQSKIVHGFLPCLVPFVFCITGFVIEKNDSDLTQVFCFCRRCQGREAGEGKEEKGREEKRREEKRREEKKREERRGEERDCAESLGAREEEREGTEGWRCRIIIITLAATATIIPPLYESPPSPLSSHHFYESHHHLHHHRHHHIVLCHRQPHLSPIVHTARPGRARFLPAFHHFVNLTIIPTTIVQPPPFNDCLPSSTPPIANVPHCQEERDFYMARSGFSCYMRLTPFQVA
jgi:hypothetical protein